MPGAQGRLLAVFAQTEAELNLRTVAQLAGISPAQASRLLPDLVELGVIERRDVPPSSLFRLVPENVASKAILALARSTDAVFEKIGQFAAALGKPPLSVVVFGSFARRMADAESDVDLLVVRPSNLGEDDDVWSAQLQGWVGDIRRLTGNRVEVLETSAGEAARKLNSHGELWSDIRRDGRVVHGYSLDELKSGHLG